MSLSVTDIHRCEAMPKDWQANHVLPERPTTCPFCGKPFTIAYRETITTGYGRSPSGKERGE
jgi:hypothetical protein